MFKETIEAATLATRDLDFSRSSVSTGICVVDAAENLQACVSVYGKPFVGQMLADSLNNGAICEFKNWVIVAGDNVTTLPAYTAIQQDPSWWSTLWANYGVPGVNSLTGVGHGWVNSTTVSTFFSTAKDSVTYCFTNGIATTYGQISAALCDNVTAFNLGNQTGFIRGVASGFQQGLTQGNATGFASGLAQGIAQGNNTALIVGVVVGTAGLLTATAAFFGGHKVGQLKTASANQSQAMNNVVEPASRHNGPEDFQEMAEGPVSGSEDSSIDGAAKTTATVLKR